eukprot:1158263-Pelagomonas_calceolata.AAC.9
MSQGKVRLHSYTCLWGAATRGKRGLANKRKGKGYTAVPACELLEGSLAGANNVPVSKPVRSRELLFNTCKRNETQSQHLRQTQTWLIRGQ